MLKLMEAGVDLRTVQYWMGHKDLESTMRYLKPNRSHSDRRSAIETDTRTDYDPMASAMVSLRQQLPRCVERKTETKGEKTPCRPARS